jgi:DNA-binding XRE family transcriptional regulator
MPVISKQGRFTYLRKAPFRWIITDDAAAALIPAAHLDEICATCDSIKDKVIEKLEKKNRELTKLLEFWRSEAHALMLKTALTSKAVPLEDMVAEVISTPEGKKAWDEAWKEQREKWRSQMEAGAISRVKYYRLLNSMDQKTLAEKLGTAQPNVSRVEHPGYNVPVVTLKKLAKIFNVKMEDLIGN